MLLRFSFKQFESLTACALYKTQLGETKDTTEQYVGDTQGIWQTCLAEFICRDVQDFKGILKIQDVTLYLEDEVSTLLKRAFCTSLFACPLKVNGRNGL